MNYDYNNKNKEIQTWIGNKPDWNYFELFWKIEKEWYLNKIKKDISI